MKSLLAMTTAALLVVGFGGVDAQANACHYTEMVQSWYHRYLHRQPDPQGLHTWVSALRRGGDPTDVQASILASDEYFCAHGHTNAGYITGMYTDLLGRAPCAHELDDWMCRMRRVNCRKQLALEFCAAAVPTTAYRPTRPVVVVPQVNPRHHHAHPVAPFAARPVVPMVRPVPNEVRFGVTYRR